MTTTQNTEVSVLAHHGVVAAGGQNLIDAAREAGLIYACLGCGTVGGIDVEAARETVAADAAPEAIAIERLRADTRDMLRDTCGEDVFDCCPDADTIVY